MALGTSNISRVAFKVFAALVAATSINFLVFFAVALYLGGDALSGKEEHGRYFLGSHGRYTEVSAQVFQYSKVHGRLVEATIPLAVLLGLVLTRGQSHKSAVLFSHGGRHKSGGA